MEYHCAREPQNSTSGVFAHGNPQKLNFWRFCARSAPENLVLYKTQWNIAAHGNLKSSGVSAQGKLRNSVFGVSAHRVRQKTSFSIRYGGVSLRTGTSETPYLEICARSAPENLVLYKARWNIAAHGNLRNSTTGVSAIRWSIAAHGNLENATTGVSAHGNLRNSVFGVSAHGVRQKTSFSIRHGGASLYTGTSETPFLDFLGTDCAKKPRSLLGTVVHRALRTGPHKLHYRNFRLWEPQKLRFWSFCAPGAPENLVLYKIRWSIAAHGNLENATTGVSAHGNLRNSVSGVSAHGVRQKTSFSIRRGGASLRTGTSETPLPEFSAYGNLRNSVFGVSAHAVRQKTSFPRHGVFLR